MSLLKVQLWMEFNAKARERLYRKLAQLLKNGVSLDRSLDQIASIEEKRRHAATAKVLRRWRTSIENGVNFGQCIAPFVPSSEALLLETGSNSGRLQEAFVNAAESVSQQRRVKNAIISAGSYPILLIVVLIAALVMASYQIIPAFGEVLPVEQWQGSAATVASLTAAIREDGVTMLICLIVFIFLVSFSLPRWTGRTRMFVEKIVPWNIYRMWQGSSFLLSVASLMASGVKIDDNALRRLATRASPYLKERIFAVARQLTAGLNLGEALARTGFNFPEDELIDDLRIYATLKGFEENLTTITRDWVGEVEGKVVAAMKVLNTIALVLIAVTLGILISSIFGVVQQIQDSANAPTG
jgi:type II secretory pathway component PulF